jgi:hypothetical protein
MSLDMATKERTTAGVVGSRAHCLERQMLMTPTTDIFIVLRNDTSRPLPVRQAQFEEER